jgi:hypothetical protein
MVSSGPARGAAAGRDDDADFGPAEEVDGGKASAIAPQRRWAARNSSSSAGTRIGQTVGPGGDASGQVGGVGVEPPPKSGRAIALGGDLSNDQIVCGTAAGRA